jgi:ubiquinone/menaquinone biosynthesis C-methylase UbiE
MISSRFDTTFKNYEISPVHRDSPTLGKTANLFKNSHDLKICDVGCGAGHFSLKLADFSNLITFVDPSERMLSMLDQKTKTLQDEMTLQFINCSAEELPLPSEYYDVVLSRLATHHFVDVKKSIQEMYRILKVGGYLIINDLVGNEDEGLDSINHDIEVLHDPTHGRSYKPSEWKRFISNLEGNIENFSYSLESPTGITIDFWCSITKVTEDSCSNIKHILNTLPISKLSELGYSKSEAGEILNHVKTVYLIFRK